MELNHFYGKNITQHRYLPEAIDTALEHNGDVDIVITGPIVGEIESENEFEDDEMLPTSATIENLPAEIVGEIENFNNFDDEEEELEENPCKKRGHPDANGRWKRESLYYSTPEEPLDCSSYILNNNPELVNLSEFEIFDIVFSDMLCTLVAQTNLYATRDKNIHNFSINEGEMKNFIGLLLLSGYNIRTNERHYWSTDSDLYCEEFVKTMSRNRFLEIKSVLHVADNLSLGANKMAKITPFYDILNNSIQNFGIFHRNFIIDESMVPYFGRHSCKQFNRGKPIRFGYKCWVIAGADDVPYNAKIYEGKELCQSNDPLGTRVVLNSIAILQGTPNCHIIFDNFFTSHNLMVKLDEMGFKATGTIRANRTNRCPLEPIDKMKKLERGSYDFRSNNIVEMVRWNDNAVVTVCSNAVGTLPLGKCMRYVKNKGSVQVSRPAAIGFYNSNMGGVDNFDRALSDLRPCISGKKWYMPLLINAINIAAVFSWKVFKIISKSKITQVEYRRCLVRVLLKKPHQSNFNIQSRPIKKTTVPDVIRMDGYGHYPESGPVRKCTFCKKKL